MDLVPHDPVPAVDFRARLGRTLRAWWDGDQTLLSSLARVNREFCLGLLDAGDVELALTERKYPWQALSTRDDPRFGRLFARLQAPLSGPPDVTVRQYFPPDWRRPDAGRFVVIQPWEFGHLPRDWVAAAREQADELWVHSRFVRDLYARSGVPAEKVRIIPLGFDPQVYRPDGPACALPTTASLRFLFVGGALHRKGADLLLEAYLRAFTAADDVCLVVKDMGTRTFYQGQTYAESFRRAQADPRSPQVLYVDDDLSDPQLAALYRACTCVVLPYRAEGFALPPLEGMACGLPAIVTSGGPTDDYLDDTMGLRLPHRRLLAGTHQHGPFECAGDPWQIEPDLDALVDALRWVRDHPGEARRRGEAACAHVHAHWTWDAADAHVRERLLENAAPQDAAPNTKARSWSEPESPIDDDRPPMADRCVTAGPVAIGEHRPAGLAVGEKRPELSLCMIVRDEEPRIADCLQSIAPHVDEIVVVDTGSTDRTREIARECGARVVDFPWTDSFAEARNQSLEQARGDWIFWMDADDVISADCGRELRRLIRCHPGRDVAYQVQVRIPPGPGEHSASLVDHVKLFPNRLDLRFEHRIHEQILPAIRRAGLQVLFSDLEVIHQNYDRSAAGQLKKRRRDFRLLELDLRDRPEHPFVLFNLGMTYLFATKEYEVAAHYLRRSLGRSDWQDSIVRKAYAMLTTARLAQGEWEAALAANEEGRRYYPDDAELLFHAGQIYGQQDRFDAAREALERLVSGSDDPHYRSVDVGLRTYRGRHELALLFRRLGDAPHAERILRKIVAEYPSYLPAQLDLTEMLAQSGAPRSSIDWDQAPVCGRRRETLIRTLQRLQELCPGPACIVETGTLRDDSPRARDSDGWSTLAWAWYAAQTGGRLVTVDIDPRNLDVCRRVTAPFARVIEYVASDSVRFLSQWRREERGEIDLLYLDSLDYFEHQREESEEHHCVEAAAVLPALAPRCLVLLDDTRPAEAPGDGDPPRFTGKGARVIPFLLRQGFRLEWAQGEQALLSRGAGVAEGSRLEPRIRQGALAASA